MSIILPDIPASRIKLSESRWAYDAGFMVFSLFPEGNATPTPPIARFHPCAWSFSSPSPKREYDDEVPPLCAIAASGHKAKKRNTIRLLIFVDFN